MNRYQIKGKIGQGGLGEVYLAWDNRLDRDVAVKRVRVPEDGNVGSLEQDLLREAKTLSALQHPNIVTIYDVGSDDKGAFVVMEYLKGETLDAVIERGQLPVDDVKKVIAQTLEGMIAAQELGLVHRDLKPSNLMVIWLASGQFQIKILDFGLAKFSRVATRQTEDQEAGILGSIYFMAPEQFERMPLDNRTDMYSLGCIFYQILTTRHPFDGETGPEVMASHMNHTVTPIRELRPDLPVWLGDWLMWLISRQMDDRPADARSALEFFKVEQSGIRNPSPPPPPPGPGHTVRIVGRGPQGVVRQPGAATQRMQGTMATARSSRATPRAVRKKKKGGAGPVIAVLLTLAAAGGGWYWWQSQKPVENPRADLEKLIAETSPAPTPGNLETVFRFLRSGGPDVPMAAGVLSRMTGPQVAEAVAKRLPDAGGAERSALIGLAGDNPSVAGTAALVKLAADQVGEVRTSALDALGRAAKPADAGALLAILPKIREEANRRKFFQMLDQILGREPDGEARVRPLAAALPRVDDKGRVDVLRLLAGTGEPAAAVAVAAELSAGGERAKAALEVLPGWVAPTAEICETLLAGAKANPIDRERMLPVFLTLIPRVSGWTAAELTARLRAAVPLAVSAPGKDAFGTALSQVAAPEAQELARELAAGSDKGLASAATKAQDAISALLARVVVMEGAEATLDAAAAEVHASGTDAYYSSTSRNITNWKSMSTGVSWDVSVTAPGAVTLEVLQSSPSRTPRSYRIRFGQEAVVRDVQPTDSAEDFVYGPGATVKLPRAGIWRLWLEPVRMDGTQSLMSVREVRIKAAAK